MINDEADRIREDFKYLLLDIAKDQKFLEDPHRRRNTYLRLENIYYTPSNESNFRHYYSDIFFIISQIDQDPSMGSIDVLAQNIRALRDGYQPKNFNSDDELIDISKEITKLYDHVDLDVARINYLKKATSISDSMKDNVQNMLNISTETLERAEENLRKSEELSNKMSNIEKEHITILGIFAAIVLAFNGGMEFSTAILSSVNTEHPVRLIAIGTLIGTVFISVMWMLLEYLHSINKSEKHFKWFMIIIPEIIIVAIMFLAWKFL